MPARPQSPFHLPPRVRDSGCQTSTVFALWYGILAAMFVIYVVLDGFDLGAGALHLAVARTDQERRTVLALRCTVPGAAAARC